jgi:hypothetical protein
VDFLLLGYAIPMGLQICKKSLARKCLISQNTSRIQILSAVYESKEYAGKKFETFIEKIGNDEGEGSYGEISYQPLPLRIQIPLFSLNFIQCITISIVFNSLGVQFLIQGL